MGLRGDGQRRLHGAEDTDEDDVEIVEVRPAPRRGAAPGHGASWQRTGEHGSGAQRDVDVVIIGDSSSSSSTSGGSVRELRGDAPPRSTGAGDVEILRTVRGQRRAEDVAPARLPAPSRPAPAGSTRHAAAPRSPRRPPSPRKTLSMAQLLPDVSASGTVSRCAICLSEYSHPVAAPCGHVFCEACMVMAVRESRACPTCRKRIPSTRRLKRLFL